jgi:hypothetical protein
MDIKVRVLDGIEPKGVAETEQMLLEKHESEQKALEEASSQANEQVNEQPEAVSAGVDLKEEDVLSFIKNRYNKEINSFDELISERNRAEEMPEDVSEYLKYKKETGRGFEDFLKLREDYDSMSPDNLLREYLSATQDGLDDEDIDVMMSDYKYDEDLDDDSRIKKVKIERKKAIAEAKKYFNSQKEKYKVPLESSEKGLSKEEKEEFDAYRKYLNESKTIEEENNRKRNWFEKKTDEVFNSGFKGFEFNVNNRKLTFNPGDAAELKKNQSNPMNFIGKFLDDNGLIKDAEGYHKSLSVAMNPEKFARFFYEQGMADATDDLMRKTKNINMSERRAPEVARQTEGVQVRALNPDSGRSLKIRSNKNR